MKLAEWLLDRIFSAIPPPPPIQPTPDKRPAITYLGYSPNFSLEEVERAHIYHVMESLQGNRSEAARVLGIDRRTLYRKLKKWGIK